MRNSYPICVSTTPQPQSVMGMFGDDGISEMLEFMGVDEEYWEKLVHDVEYGGYLYRHKEEKK